MYLCRAPHERTTVPSEVGVGPHKYDIQTTRTAYTLHMAWVQRTAPGEKTVSAVESPAKLPAAISSPIAGWY